jgi:hypothetical protein
MHPSLGSSTLLSTDRETLRLELLASARDVLQETRLSHHRQRTLESALSCLSHRASTLASLPPPPPPSSSSRGLFSLLQANTNPSPNPGAVPMNLASLLLATQQMHSSSSIVDAHNAILSHSLGEQEARLASLRARDTMNGSSVPTSCSVWNDFRFAPHAPQRHPPYFDHIVQAHVEESLVARRDRQVQLLAGLDACLRRDSLVAPYPCAADIASHQKPPNNRFLPIQQSPPSSCAPVPTPDSRRGSTSVVTRTSTASAVPVQSNGSEPDPAQGIPLAPSLAPFHPPSDPIVETLRALGSNQRLRTDPYIDCLSFSRSHNHKDGNTLHKRWKKHLRVSSSASSPNSDDAGTHALEPFPEKVHRLLTDAEHDEALAAIVSFLPHGRAFRVHQVEQFVTDILPQYFHQTKWSSFTRQLNLWGFSRLYQKGGSVKTSGGGTAFYHELFLRGCPDLCLYMKRVGATSRNPMLRKKLLAAKPPAAGGAEQSQSVDPDFDGMPPAR